MSARTSPALTPTGSLSIARDQHDPSTLDPPLLTLKPHPNVTYRARAAISAGQGEVLAAHAPRAVARAMGACSCARTRSMGPALSSQVALRQSASTHLG